MATATGAGAGVVAPGAGVYAKGFVAQGPGILNASVEVMASGATQGLINASGDYALGAIDGNGQWNNGTVGSGIVSAGIGQISKFAPDNNAWGTFSTISSEILSEGTRLNADLISSSYYQPTVTSPIAPIYYAPAP